MPMLLENFTVPRSLFVHECLIEKFWLGSRFKGVVAGLDLKDGMKRALEEMEAGGGFYATLVCEMDGRVVGSLVVFKDPWYRSRQRADVACFGLVTARDVPVLRVLLDEAARVARKHGASALRGPVNPPRNLFGYGVQVSGYTMPAIAGSSINGEHDAVPFMELDCDGYFDTCDRYFNLSQDAAKTFAYIKTFDLDRSFQVVNPDLDNLGDMPAKVAQLMNDTLGYRADYQWTSADRLAAQAKMYKMVPGGEKLMGFFMDGDTLAGGVIMQPDWFQVMRGKPATTIIGDIYMLAPAYQGRRLFMNCSEYSLNLLAERNTKYYEHASIHEGTSAILSSVKHGYSAVTREFRVFEVGL